jgi:two-component system response regulator AlgR
MTLLRVLVVDDEPLARRRLERGVARSGVGEVVGAAANGVEAMRLVGETRPDLILLDVRMPGMNGFDLVAQFPDDPPMVVFVSAFDEYATRAFDAAAIDYVLKPVDFNRLELALRRARDARESVQARDRARQLEEVVAALRVRDAKGESPFLSELWVRAGGDLRRIRANEIDWIAAEGDYARLHVGKRNYLCEQSLGALAQRLDPDVFMRVHRSAIVRLDAVTALRKTGFRAHAALLACGAVAPIGRTYAKKVMARLAPDKTPRRAKEV